MAEQFGTVINLGFDDTGRERRRKVTAICDCPTCGQEVSLWSETDEWTKRQDGKWHHIGYDACSMGECCGNVLIDTFDGAMVIDLRGDGSGT